MESTFNAIETLTIEQFKAKMNVSKLDVKRNPKTGKIFFSFGTKTGAVTTKCPLAELKNGAFVSLMPADPENGHPDEVWLLHKEGQGAEVLATF